jgi:ectoine hydroxylase-related dioxygenase (phytanoyl-CoA dioxygenase family)
MNLLPARRAYERHGFAVVRRAVPPALLRRFRDQLAGGTGMTWSQLRKAPVDEQDVARLRALSYRCPELREICHGPRLLGAIGSLIGAEGLYVHPRRFLRANPPGNGSAAYNFRFHQDYAAVKGSASAVTVWMPLHRCKTGGLALVAGSHHQGLRAVRAGSFGALPYEVAETGALETRSPELELGDAVIFSCFTVHATDANRGRLVRFSIDFRVQSVAEPLHASQLLPCIAVDESLRGAPHLWTEDPEARLPSSMRLVFDDARSTDGEARP